MRGALLRTIFNFYYHKQYVFWPTYRSPSRASCCHPRFSPLRQHASLLIDDVRASLQLAKGNTVNTADNVNTFVLLVRCNWKVCYQASLRHRSCFTSPNISCGTNNCAPAATQKRIVNASVLQSFAILFPIVSLRRAC